MARRKPLCPVYDQETGSPNHRCNKKTKRGSKFCPEHDLTHEVALIPCTGEAHSNPYIDHCMLCAPRWGQMEVMQLKSKDPRPTLDEIPEL